MEVCQPTTRIHSEFLALRRGGVIHPFSLETAMDFLNAMRLFVPDHANVMMCQFRGDPEQDVPGRWRSRPIKNVDVVDEKANVYFCVSAMGKNDKGEWRRRKANFVGGILLMIDDLGSGVGSKFPLSILNPITPTALIETSPNNFQAIYMFDSLVKDLALFEALISAFIEAQFLGKDTGMAGVNRVFRPPLGVNGKPKHQGWPITLRSWNPDCRYSVEEIAAKFELELNRRGPRLVRAATVDKKESVLTFLAALRLLRSAGMIKTDKPDQAGWIQVRCPWLDEHTGGKDNGAALCIPNQDNGYTGGFKCFHGCCDGKGWREFSDWVTQEAEALLAAVNRNAKPYEYYERSFL